MSKRKRYILLGILASLLIGILVLVLLLRPKDFSPEIQDDVISDTDTMPDYTVEGISTELGDLTVYDVTVNGEPYKLVKIKGQSDQLIPYEDYYRAEVGDTE